MSTQNRFTASFCLLFIAAGLVGCTTSPEAKAANFLKRGKALLAQ
jgi:hypothetical protein